MGAKGELLETEVDPGTFLFILLGLKDSNYRLQFGVSLVETKDNLVLD